MVNKYIKQIEEVGYALIPDTFDNTTVTKLLELCKSHFEQSKRKVSQDVPYLNLNHPTLYNLQNKDLFFLKSIFSSNELREILIHFLNDKWYKQIPADQPNYILRSFGARSSTDPMPLHIDSFIPYSGKEVIVMQCAIILEDQNLNNGCTVVVPGSHQAGEYAEQDKIDNAIPIQPKKGDLVIWDSRLWHGTTKNISGGSRWSAIATFSRWWIKQNFNITNNLPQKYYSELSSEERSILGYCSIPYETEYQGIDLKRGHNQLLEQVESYKS